MLEELHVRELGVIPALTLTLGPGMTALTGETGAGKTLLVTAIELLVGGRADPMLVRPGAPEARIDGRFLTRGGGEVVVSRVVPASGRSRGYIDGRPASVAELAELGARLVDLHGQHAHQSLLHLAAQRDALDRYASIDLGPLRAAAAEVRRLDVALAGLGGDDAARARECDFLRFQIAEIEAAGLQDPGEDAALEAEEDLLADAQAHQEAAARAHEALSGDGGASDALTMVLAALRDRPPFAGLEARARGLAAELADVGAELRDLAESIEPDPERLEAVRARRQQLRDLHRKYGTAGDATLVESVLDTWRVLSDRLTELEGHEERAAELQATRTEAAARLAGEQARVGSARRAAAPRLAEATQANLVELAMPKARLDVAVGADDPGDEVTFLLAANPGAPLLPLAKVASGGELARTMLALRLTLHEAAVPGAAGAEPPGARVERRGASGELDGDQDGEGDHHDGAVAGTGPGTMIFDEVDAGIGVSAASAVGRALARLGDDRQVLVVTHLAQVAAWGDAQVAVAKSQDDDATVSLARAMHEEERIVELARMLSGSPDSATAQQHAAELLDEAGAARRPGSSAPCALAAAALAGARRSPGEGVGRSRINGLGGTLG
jgi:DNA repair protein RecN (Recombination protein N)